LAGLLERAGFDDPNEPEAVEENGGHAVPSQPEPVFGGLRMAEN
jgi:hypothetical protein